MAKKTATTKQATAKATETIVIFEPRAGAPPNLLATAAIHFNEGVLAGMDLTGIALWDARRDDGEAFVSVTLPAREGDDTDERRYFDYLRGHGEQYRRLKEAVIAAFKVQVRARRQEAVAEAS